MSACAEPEPALRAQVDARDLHLCGLETDAELEKGLTSKSAASI